MCSSAISFCLFPVFLSIPTTFPPCGRWSIYQFTWYNKHEKKKRGIGGDGMLEAVTRKYEDGSTLEYFRFTFFCDSCGKAVKVVTYPYKPPFKPKIFLTKSERRARELIWQCDHAVAYERANKEVLISFNQCPACYQRICDDCFDEDEGVCIMCRKEKRNV